MKLSTYVYVPTLILDEKYLHRNNTQDGNWI